MGPLLRAKRHGPVRSSGAADDHRRAHRESDLDRRLCRRQDLLLLHERQGHRTAPHLGGADRRRHAGTDHRGRGRRDLPGSARLRQVLGDAERQLEHSAIAGCVEVGNGSISGPGPCAEDHLPNLAAGISDGRPRKTGDYYYEGPRRAGDPQSGIPAEGLESG